MKLYVDGKEIASANSVATGNKNSPRQNCCLSEVTTNQATVHFYDIDELIIYPKALAADVEAHYISSPSGN